MSQYWLRYWLCAAQVSSHYLNQWWPSILTHVSSGFYMLTHWSRVTHIYVSKLTIIGSDNGLSPDWCQAIIWTNAGLLIIGALGTNFSGIFIEIIKFSFKKMHLKVSSAKRRHFALASIQWNFTAFIMSKYKDKTMVIYTFIMVLLMQVLLFDIVIKSLLLFE